MRIFIIVGIFCLGLISCENMGGGSSSITDQKDSISYALGRDIAQNFQNQSIELSPEAFLVGLKESMETERSMTDEQIQQVIAAFQQEMRMKQMQQQLQQQQMQQQNNPGGGKIGEMAPEIALNTPEGNVLKLSDLKGKYVLVDFWASWCKPCRRENPNVVRAYNKYKDKGFEILGVSLDRNRDRWLQAIQADGLTWKHVSDLKYFQCEAAVDYGVSAIPFTVLVDKEGKVVAQNLRGPSLERKLEELFGPAS